MNTPKIGMIPTLYDDDPNRPKPSQGCIEGVRRAGGEVVVIDYNTPLSDLEAMARTFDGWLFQGGDDINPACYGEKTLPECGPIYDPRDELELFVFKIAHERDIPIFGICRGMQVINVGLGGTLYQDLPSELGLHHHLGTELYPHHVVSLAQNSLAHRAAGSLSFPANSTHHQSVKSLGNGLVVVGRTSDGVVESVELPEARFLLGVQWHPEITLDQNEPSMKFFQAFVDACKA